MTASGEDLVTAGKAVARVARRRATEVGPTQNQLLRSHAEPALDGLGPGLPLNPALLNGLQRAAGNLAVSRLLRGEEAVPLQRQPVAVGEAGQQVGASEPEWPLWARSSSTDPLPGDPVPAYEQADQDRFSKLLWGREKDNKRNAGAYLGSFGGALTDLWGKHLTEAMKEAGAEAGWSTFQKILKFVAIKTFELTVAELLTPAGVEVLEAIGAKIGEKLVEKAAEWSAAAYGEVRAEKREETTKEEQLAEKKRDLDAITKKFAELMEQLAPEVLSLLPDIQPYDEWLRHAQPYQLARFRLPALFPATKKGIVRATVAGLIVGELHGIVRPEDPNRVDFYDDDIIIVRDMGYAQIYSSSPEIVKAIAGKVPISQLPTVPLFIDYMGGYTPAAERLMRAFRGVDPTPKEVEEFLAGYPDPTSVIVTRSSDGDVAASGGGLAGNLKLYIAGTGDTGLVKLAQEVLDWAHGEAEYEKEIGKAPNEGISRLADPADLGKKTHYYLQEAGSSVDWARTMITSEILKLVPQKPVDRWHEWRHDRPPGSWFPWS